MSEPFDLIFDKKSNLSMCMPAGGKRPGAGRPKGSKALTLIASTGQRMSFYEAARHYEHEALQVIVSVFMDEKQPASLRLAAANDLLDRAYGRPPVAVQVDATTRERAITKIIHEVRWLPPDPADKSKVIEHTDE
jgi:hypothetical protein